MALDCKIDVHCVVQRSLLWFAAPTDLNRISGTELKMKKCHEVVNGAIMGAILKPFSGKHTEVVYVNFGGQSLTTHKERNQ